MSNTEGNPKLRTTKNSQKTVETLVPNVVTQQAIGKTGTPRREVWVTANQQADPNKNRSEVPGNLEETVRAIGHDPRSFPPPYPRKSPMAYSTPAHSPNVSLSTDRMPSVMNTPLGQGEYQDLLDIPEDLLDILPLPTEANIDSYLAGVAKHVEYYGNRFIHEENWIQSYKVLAKSYSSYLDQIQEKCSALSLRNQLAKCFAIRSELSKHSKTLELKEKTTIVIPATNTDKENVEENVTGHPNGTSYEASTTVGTQTTLKDDPNATLDHFNRRLIGLENKLCHFSSRVVGVENRVGPIDDFISRLSNLESDHVSKAALVNLQQSCVSNSNGMKSVESIMYGLNDQVMELSSKIEMLLSSHQPGPIHQPDKLNVVGPGITALGGNLIHQQPPVMCTLQGTSRFQQAPIGSHRPPFSNPTGKPFSQRRGDKPIPDMQGAPGFQHSSENIILSDDNGFSSPQNSTIGSTSTDSLDHRTEDGMPSNLSNRGKRLFRDSINLKHMLKPKIGPKLTKLQVQAVHKNLLRSVDDERKELVKALDKYENSSHPDTTLIDKVDAIIGEAQAWSRGMREKYSELDCDKRSLDKKLYDGLKQFGEDSELHIFEFLQKFEAYTEEQGTAKERATLLYEQYLHTNIQLELVDKSTDYSYMKKWLIKRFGEVKVITDNVLKLVSKERIPTDCSSDLASASYYRRLNSVVKKLQELSKTVDLPNDELITHIYSSEFLAKLLRYVPRRTELEFRERLAYNGEDVDHIKGRAAFSTLAMTIYSHFSALSGAVRHIELDTKEELQKEKTSIKKKSVQKAKEESTHGVHFQGVKSKKDQSDKQRFRHPCTLPQHTHEVGECAEFYTKTPKERQQLGKKKVCFTCMGPKVKCAKLCANLNNVPIEAICQKCKEWADSKNLSPLNVLYCKNKKHQKPDNQVVLDALKSWIKGFKPASIQAPVQLAAHFNLIGHSSVCRSCKSKTCKCDRITKTSPVNDSLEVPAWNTESGEKVNVKEENLITEVEEDTFYVMQLLKINDQDCLAFYDRGANQHLIEGQFAESIQAKVVCDRPSSLGIVGGGEIWTEYGRYKLELGPNQLGKYYVLTAQGISQVTGHFPKYSLSSVNKELVECDVIQDCKLPKYIGGQKVQLLVSLKDPDLEPVNLFQLPSGIGVYKSPFVDKFGSNICYGGPHKIFSNVNEKCKGNFNHVNIYFSQMVNQYKNSIYPSLSKALHAETGDDFEGIVHYEGKDPKYRLRTETGCSVYPTPLTSSDFEELGSPELDEDSDGNEANCSICKLPAKQSVHKTRVPLQKLKDFLDKDDISDTINYRCSTCLACECMVSDKAKMMSLQERMEQDVIQKSVEIDLVANKVLVDLPFIKPPVEYLTEKHGDSSNYKQAYKVYITQCKKTDRLKDGIRSMHTDLVKREFLKKLDDLSPKQQQIIRQSGFKHYMPWRTVEKSDSISTPVRLVVDPSMSGLNLILAKGTNSLTKINSILIRSRCRRYVWNTDVSKLYNHLVLKDTALPYGLFLYDESLNPLKKPTVYVMMVAWYGVTSSGNQSGEALSRLGKIGENEFPLASSILEEDRYVDDIFSGSNSKITADDQVNQVRSAIAKGNFPLKFVVKSGEMPCELASADGETVKVLGYKWKPHTDVLGPGFSEINFAKRNRGAKTPNPFPVVSPSDVLQLLESKNISRRMVISKIAEIFDPLGLWEPYKLQLKLEAQSMNGIDWDVALDPEVQNHWRGRFQEFLEIPHLATTRCIIPDNAVCPDKIRLICVSDAAVSAGGCAIYGTYLQTDGKYSCKLLVAKSRRMKGTIPRNELESVRLMAEMAHDVKVALGSLIGEVLFFTDSTIAMSWCHNIEKKLRLFVLNRVSQVRRFIHETAGDTSEFPLYHIEGKHNVADLLTKPHNIKPSDLGMESIWQNGPEWMLLPLNEMPITRYSDISVTKEDEVTINLECFPEPSFTSTIHFASNRLESENHCDGCYMASTRSPLDKCYGVEMSGGHCEDCVCKVTFSCCLLKKTEDHKPLLDIIKFGFLKTMRITSLVLKFVSSIHHKLHIKKGVQVDATCMKCIAEELSAKVSREMDKHYSIEALNYYLRVEARRMSGIISKKKLQTLTFKDGIFYHKGRLTEENPVTTSSLDFNIFYDSQSIKKVLPVILADSDLYFALVMHIHQHVRIHAGVEITMKEVLKTVFVLNNPRRIIQKIRRKCSWCRTIAENTLELEMADHPKARTQICPPFYNCMADTVFGFKGQVYKKARQTIKIYAFIIICLLTSAVNILACEGLETQDIIQALERHSGRHGVPNTIYVDNGTQLAALQNTEFSLRDVNAHVLDSMGMEIVTSAAKSHQERGRVERRVRTLREMLKKLSVKDNTCMTALQWETLFAKISSHMNDLPMAKSDRSNFGDATWDLLTPNRLLLGRNNLRSLEGPINLLKGAGATEILRRNRNLQQYFYQMMLDRLHNFIHKPSKWSKTDPVKVGDICIFIYNENSAMKQDVWKLGEVSNIDNPSKLIITFMANSKGDSLPRKKTIVRSPRQVCVISNENDLNLNSREFFEYLKQQS